MKRLTTALGCLLILQFSCCSKSADDTLLGTNCAMLTTNELLAKRRLMKDVHLDNSRDIYEVVARLLAEQSGSVEPMPDGDMTPELTLIWQGNPTADEKTFTVDLKRGTSVMKMMEEIVARRGEHLIVKSGNYMAITSSAKTLLPTYQQQGINPSADLSEAMKTFILISIIMCDPGYGGFEEFLNIKLQHALASRKDASVFQFVSSDAAKRKTSKLNVIGTWNYLDLCEAFGQVADLRWRIEGTEIHLRDTSEK